MAWTQLIELRKKAGLSQEKLADQIGVTQKSISKYEKQDARPSWEALIAMADLFNVSIDYLLERSRAATFNVSTTPSPISYPLSDNAAMLLENFEKLGKEDQALILGKTIELVREQQKTKANAMPLKKVQ